MRRQISNASKYAVLGIAGWILVATGTIAVGQWWVTRSSGDATYEAIDEVPAREIALVPGVGAKNQRMNQMLLERLRSALALYRAHKVEAILVSGIGVGPNGEIEVMRRWLRLRGVPPEQIISDPAGHRTLDTMQRAARFLNVRGAIVCTQGLFISRALFLARSAGIDAVGLIAPQRRPYSVQNMRLETAKSGLAIIDTYLLHRGPRVLSVDGIVDGRTQELTLAAAPSHDGRQPGPP